MNHLKLLFVLIIIRNVQANSEDETISYAKIEVTPTSPGSEEVLTMTGGLILQMCSFALKV